MDRQTAEQKVFGGAFSFDDGYAGEEAMQEYIDRIVSASENNEPIVWVTRNFDADFGICANLWVRGVPTLILSHDYQNQLSSVYTYPVKGYDDGTLIVEDVPFEEAVEAAEEYIQPRLKAPANIDGNRFV